ncbi:MAG: pyridoxal phosphate-dependent aminotransferase [Bradymonadales bacterium]|jgi:alanine-synthesizing transaminase
MYFTHSRTPAIEELQDNAWTRAWEDSVSRRSVVFDLTASNPTTLGLPSIALNDEILREAAQLPYRPDSLGQMRAREAVSAYYNDAIAAKRICLFASTSEAFAAIFKLLCAPGDELMTFFPGYPLLDCICRLEALNLRKLPLEDSAGRWEIDFYSLKRAITPKTRAIIVVSPNNPTGQCISFSEFENLIRFCAEQKLALVVDEVYADYMLEAGLGLLGRGAAALAQEGLVFSLSGLSKVCGLPQHKLAWCAVGGSPALCDEAMERISYIADTNLSASTWVQELTPYFLSKRSVFRDACMRRIRANYEYLRSRCDGLRWRPDPIDGAWFAPIRIFGSDDDVSLSIYLAKKGIRVFAGSFFSYHAYRPSLVLSLLCRQDTFVRGVEALRAELA